MNCFLDRDGVFNIDNGYVGKIDDFIWHKEIFEIMSLLSNKGYKLIMITNQSGISRGFYSLNDFIDLSFYIINKLRNKGLDIEINFCNHLPSDNCLCRKPKSGMLLKYQITKNDIFIGDKDIDMIAAQGAGIKNRWLLSTKSYGPFTKQFCDHKSLLSFCKMKFGI